MRPCGAGAAGALPRQAEPVLERVCQPPLRQAGAHQRQADLALQGRALGGCGGRERGVARRQQPRRAARERAAVKEDQPGLVLADLLVLGPRGGGAVAARRRAAVARRGRRLAQRVHGGPLDAAAQDGFPVLAALLHRVRSKLGHRAPLRVLPERLRLACGPRPGEPAAPVRACDKAGGRAELFVEACELAGTRCTDAGPASVQSFCEQH